MRPFAVRFSVEETRRHGGMHHFDLLNHPDVWQSMRSLLAATVATGTRFQRSWS